jgi:hypothetical protein
MPFWSGELSWLNFGRSGVLAGEELREERLGDDEEEDEAGAALPLSLGASFMDASVAVSLSLGVNLNWTMNSGSTCEGAKRRYSSSLGV